MDTLPQSKLPRKIQFRTTDEFYLRVRRFSLDTGHSIQKLCTDSLQRQMDLVARKKTRNAR